MADGHLEQIHVAELDMSIEEGRARVRRQISLIRKLRKDGHSTVMAERILHEFLETNRVMRQIRKTAMSGLR